MMRLQVGQSAVFKAGNGEHLYGKVTAIIGRHYRVHVAGRHCGMYADGLFRFTDADLIQ